MNWTDLDKHGLEARSKPLRSVENRSKKGGFFFTGAVHGPEHRRGLVPAVEPQAHRSTGAGEGVTEEDGGDEEDDNQIGEGARRHIRELARVVWDAAASSPPTPAPSSSPPASLTLA
jgi:hypothetical protein